MPKTTAILAIETSCDETGVAVLCMAKSKHMEVLAQAVASQVDIHKETGGVVPDVAAREHTKVIGPLIKKIIKESGVELDSLDAIAVTVGPGLMPALAVGVQAARTLAFALNKPIVPVHHLEGHIASALLSAEENPSASRRTKAQNPNVFEILNNKEIFPALGLIVSGGHTMLVETKNWLHYNVLGQTRDDAAGEAFDKVARLLDLPYPGGPNLSKLAAGGDATAFAFPRPMLDSGDLDFSFSGLKTAVLYGLRDHPNAKKEDIAASFQMAVVDSLTGKTTQALRPVQQVRGQQYRAVLLAGGVAANTLLRERMQQLADEHSLPLKIAPLALCGDNAVMIGQIGVLAYANGRQIGWQEVDAKARIPLESFGH